MSAVDCGFKAELREGSESRHLNPMLYCGSTSQCVLLVEELWRLRRDLDQDDDADGSKKERKEGRNLSSEERLVEQSPKWACYLYSTYSMYI